MARFATKTATTKKTTNRKVKTFEGGDAYQLSPKKELATFLLTSFMNGGFYVDKAEQHDRLVELVKNVDPIFAAQAAIYARDKFGMRTVTHVVGGLLPELVKGEPWIKNFLNGVIVRPDDAVEMVAYSKHVVGGPIPNSLKKGVIIGLRKFDGYQLAKWNKAGRFNLVDTINLVTGGGNGRYRANVISDVANQLVRGELEVPATWEAQLSQAGQSGENADSAKAEVWADQVLSGKIGQMALLMNLRNIGIAATKLKNGDEVIAKAVELLTNPRRIEKARLFPFRYMTASDQLVRSEIGNKNMFALQNALSTALDLAVVAAVPRFEGNTLVAVDDSGSMTWGNVGGDRAVRRMVADVAAQLAAFVYKANPDADVVMFANDTKRAKPVNPNDTTTTVVDGFRSQIGTGGGTYFESILRWAKNQDKVYDRLIILSDMQGANGIIKQVNDYRKKNENFFVHSVDLQGYGTSMLPEGSNVAQYAGFSEKIFSLMAQAEEDPNVLVTEIEAIEIAA